MTFREAMAAAINKAGPVAGVSASRLSSAKQRLAAKPRFPRIAKAIEHIVANEYEKATGIKVGAGFDWSTAIKWMVENIGPILKLILPLILAL